jgi:hypothetical protein
MDYAFFPLLVGVEGFVLFTIHGWMVIAEFVGVLLVAHRVTRKNGTGSEIFNGLSLITFILQ